MREILFRGKKVDNKQWTYGLPTYDMECVYIFGENDFDSPDSYMVDAETIGQFIGFVDKLNNKIFSGDVCIHSDKENYPNPLVVEWIEECACFAFVDKLDFNKRYYFQDIDMKYIKIIGNIHDNKGLLKQNI